MSLSACNEICGTLFTFEIVFELLIFLFSDNEYPAFPIRHIAKIIIKTAYTFTIRTVSPGFL